MKQEFRELLRQRGRAELPRVLLSQAVWGALIWRLGRMWIGRNLRRLILQGG